MVLPNPPIQLTLVFAVLLLVACGSRDPAPQPQSTRPVATLFPTIAAAAPTPAAALAPNTGWLTGGAGITVRHMRVAGSLGQPAIPLIVVRIDPAVIRLRVGYAPTQPRALRSWFAE